MHPRWPKVGSRSSSCNNRRLLHKGVEEQAKRDEVKPIPNLAGHQDAVKKAYKDTAICGHNLQAWLAHADMLQSQLQYTVQAVNSWNTTLGCARERLKETIKDFSAFAEAELQDSEQATAKVSEEAGDIDMAVNKITKMVEMTGKRTQSMEAGLHACEEDQRISKMMKTKESFAAMSSNASTE